ncbi:formylglycine-generating enzyme family protein [Argonema galeatum]|uniref:formylglycine-generating enzyme family protein n=1 Tax=Argonema galeatum TaxID=2942762 RepID=UPI0030840AB2
MTENPNQPREFDVVMGGQNPPLINAVVLGGIEGVKRRLNYPDVEVRIAALWDALKYGEAGLDLVIQALQDKSKQIKFTAYSLLKDRTEPKVKHKLDKFLPRCEFDVITVDVFGQEISRRRQEARYFIDDLGNGVFLEMVLIIGGTFLMGSPEYGIGWIWNEIPQHQVTVPSFFMGKYQVTQAQWQVVAALPQINISLNPNPSYFQGANRPVEKISWHEVEEFCARLSRETGKIYRLPSEAEWEYACRAGTTTPFHFGRTITAELANYNAHYIYASAPKGIFHQQTTDVGSFLPNDFGLYDMHGNVSEWCADPWHDKYKDAPIDASVWEEDSNNNGRLMRGGSWGSRPGYCRSASRSRQDAGNSDSLIGFRVVCAAPWN